MMSAKAICLEFIPCISIIVLAFVFGLTTVFDFALHNLLLEGSVLAEQHYVSPDLLWNFDYNLHFALLTMSLL